mmetsp:Transcript_6517/g.14516  ORF Transcript_6517/g.14516 Transcript_6517/m.14516 type:complete len:145 (-) Transcript_6517:650-1084(-)
MSIEDALTFACACVHSSGELHQQRTGSVTGEHISISMSTSRGRACTCWHMLHGGLRLLSCMADSALRLPRNGASHKVLICPAVRVQSCVVMCCHVLGESAVARNNRETCVPCVLNTSIGLQVREWAPLSPVVDILPVLINHGPR